MQATIKEEPLEEENEEEESRDDFAPQQRSRWQLDRVFLYFYIFVFLYFCILHFAFLLLSREAGGNYTKYFCISVFSYCLIFVFLYFLGVFLFLSKFQL